MVIRRIIGYFSSDSERTDRIWAAANEARNWTVSIVAVFIAVKIGLLATESTISLRWWEWFLAPFAFTYQHVIASAAVFAVFWCIVRLGQLKRFLARVSVGMLAAAQVVLTFMHIASLRVEHILRTYPTFEMTSADAEANIFTSQLFDPTNLGYTLSGLALSAMAVALPLLLLKRLKLRSLRQSWWRWLAAFFVWTVIGAGCEAAMKSDVGVAASDPIIYYVADIVYKEHVGKATVKAGASRKFQTRPLYGDASVVRTRNRFSNLSEWRKTKKNVILIVMESSPVHQMSFFGPVKVGRENRDTTPRLRQLRNHMLTLENHYTVHPTSMNALFSIGCSLYPYPAGGIITRINPRIPCRSISEVFDEAGYETALFHSGKFSFWMKRKFYDNRGFAVMHDARSMPGHKSAAQFKWGIDELVTARAVGDYIHKHRESPFFIQYIPVFPHVPYDFPDGDFAVFPKVRSRDKYHNSLRYADKAVGLVFDTLRKEKLLDDTLVVVVGDHGEAFLEHKGNRVHSIYIYEENVHVAAAFYNPLLFPTHVATQKVTGHVDLLPTITDLVGLTAGRWWQGHSLLEDGPSPLTYFYADWGPEFVGLRDGRYKVIYDLDKKKFEVYDLVADPREHENLIGTYPSRLARYRRAITQWRDYQIALIPHLKK